MEPQVAKTNASGAWKPAPGIVAPPYVDASLAYLVASGGKPAIDAAEPGDRVTRNGRFESFRVRIANGRMQRPAFSLDREGFTLVRHETSATDFGDDDAIRRLYYPEMERLLERVTRASRVHVFDHNVRRDGGVEHGASRPVRHVHNDYTADSAPRRVTSLLGEEGAAAFAGRRLAIINVWRPIRGPVETAPLALADARSVAPADLVATDLIYPDRVGEIYYAAHDPRHRWVYFPRMEADEAVLIKGYDSLEDGRARFTLHSAFDDPMSPAGAAPRESIEVRALVFFD
jgi:hypothetical protein